MRKGTAIRNIVLGLVLMVAGVMTMTDGLRSWQASAPDSGDVNASGSTDWGWESTSSDSSSWDWSSSDTSSSSDWGSWDSGSDSGSWDSGGFDSGSWDSGGSDSGSW